MNKPWPPSSLPQPSNGQRFMNAHQAYKGSQLFKWHLDHSFLCICSSHGRKYVDSRGKSLTVCASYISKDVLVVTLSRGMSFDCTAFRSTEKLLKSARTPLALSISGNTPRYLPDNTNGPSDERSGVGAGNTYWKICVVSLGSMYSYRRNSKLQLRTINKACR